jgi:toxin ParE1/3/4
MGKVTRTPQAEESRLEIWNYIARDNVDAADRMIRRIDEKCARYADSPLL